MSNKSKSKDIEDIFESGDEIRLKDIDEAVLVKVIIHALSAMLTDSQGEPPLFTVSNNFMFMEIEDLRFTVEIRSNKKYQ